MSQTVDVKHVDLTDEDGDKINAVVEALEKVCHDLDITITTHRAGQGEFLIEITSVFKEGDD